MKVVSATAGCLVTLEGGEGAGKSTQIRLLQQWLLRAGLSVTLTREPGGTPLGEQLRNLLLDPTLGALTPSAEMLLFSAARAEAVQQVIRPALERGDVVLSDRFVDSSLVYQGYGLGLDLGFIRSVGRQVCAGVWPDLTLVLDLPPEVGAQRRSAARTRVDRIEARGPDYHLRVRRGYLDLAVHEPERVRVVDASRRAEAVQQEIRRQVADVLRVCGLPVSVLEEGGGGAT